MEEIIKKLTEYGKVMTCKKVNEDVVTIVLTTGFSGNAVETLLFLKDCLEFFPKHKKVTTIITEKDFAMLVLIK
jgi:hypothetical protein